MNSTKWDDAEIKAMREVNSRQKSYYEIDPNDPSWPKGFLDPGDVPKRQRFVSALWSKMRDDVASRVRSGIGMTDAANRMHKEWLGDLSDKRVLDLGCHQGNPLSLYLAQESREYLGIDLSESAISILQSKIAGIEGASAVAIDFLDPEFEWGKFDVVYAKSVIHHFQYLEHFLEVLHSRINEDGIVVTLDPLTTSLPVRIARSIYRPFQTDADWEWPFDHAALKLISDYFNVDKVQGLMGKSKWAIPIALVSPKRSIALGSKWHKEDLDRANKAGKNLYNCMLISMRLVRSQNAPSKQHSM